MAGISARHIKVLTLLATIVFGGLFAPASHLVYMYLGDFHAPEMQHVDHFDARYEAGVAADSPAASRVGTRDARYECPYLALFATSLIAELIGDDQKTEESDHPELGRTVPEAPHNPVSFTSCGVRGPPQV